MSAPQFFLSFYGGTLAFILALVVIGSACAPARPPSPAQVDQSQAWHNAGTGLPKWVDMENGIRCFYYDGGLSCVRMQP